MVPHRVRSGRREADLTFSTMVGTGSWASRLRTVGTMSTWPPRPPWVPLTRVEEAGQGGLAWMASNSSQCSSRYSMASPSTKPKG